MASRRSSRQPGDNRGLVRPARYVISHCCGLGNCDEDNETHNKAKQLRVVTLTYHSGVYVDPGRPMYLDIAYDVSTISYDQTFSYAVHCGIYFADAPSDGDSVSVSDPLKTVSRTSNPDQSKSTTGRCDQILDKETCKEDVNMLINLDGGTKE